MSDYVLIDEYMDMMAIVPYDYVCQAIKDLNDRLFGLGPMSLDEYETLIWDVHNMPKEERIKFEEQRKIMKDLGWETKDIGNIDGKFAPVICPDQNFCGCQRIQIEFKIIEEA